MFDLLQSILEVCFFLFLVRVFGHIYVYYKSPVWLPPFDHWYSGTISYRAVAAWQTYMVSISAAGVLDVRFKLGLFSHEFWVSICPAMIVISYLYFGGMIFRYIWTMVRKPERRWFKRTIPIWAHMVTAVYVYCLSKLILAMYAAAVL